jgi:hypothetical protein
MLQCKSGRKIGSPDLNDARDFVYPNGRHGKDMTHEYFVGYEKPDREEQPGGEPAGEL